MFEAVENNDCDTSGEVGSCSGGWCVLPGIPVTGGGRSTVNTTGAF